MERVIGVVKKKFGDRGEEKLFEMAKRYAIARFIGFNFYKLLNFPIFSPPLLFYFYLLLFRFFKHAREGIDLWYFFCYVGYRW